MSRGDQIIRQWRLITLLESRPERTVADLARELGCSERTIWRDLQDVEAAGFPLGCEKREGRSHYRLLEGFRCHLPFPLSYSELLSLYLSRSLLQPLQGTPFSDSFDSLFAKLRSLLSEPLLCFLQKVKESLSSRQLRYKDYSASGPLIEQVTQAIMDRQTLEIRYHSFSRGRVQVRKIDPYRLWYQEGGIYLAAYCHLRQKVLMFALERILEIRPTSHTFVLPEGFDLEDYVRGSFGLLRGEPVRVKILFSARQAPWIAERIWHPSQRLQYQLDGSLLMSLEVADTLELKRWILGFGREAEVMEPKELREEIRREAEAVTEVYSGARAKGQSRRAQRYRTGRRKGTERPAAPLRIEIV
jgi:predicted DNA-binding transcriptional regulator YafY